MNGENKSAEKEHFALYMIAATIVLVAVILVVKLNENDKFAPIKALIDEENQQMNIRVIANRGE
jgi:hypothetical protein